MQVGNSIMKSLRNDYEVLYNTARNIDIVELDRVKDLASVFDGGAVCIENFIRASIQLQELCYALKQYEEVEFRKKLSEIDKSNQNFVESLKSAVVTKEGIVYL